MLDIYNVADSCGSRSVQTFNIALTLWNKNQRILQAVMNCIPGSVHVLCTVNATQMGQWCIQCDKDCCDWWMSSRSFMKYQCCSKDRLNQDTKTQHFRDQWVSRLKPRYTRVTWRPRLVGTKFKGKNKSSYTPRPIFYERKGKHMWLWVM